MSHRERVLAAIEHREPDAVPVDFAELVTRPVMAEVIAHFNTDRLDEIAKALDVDLRTVKTEPSETFRNTAVRDGYWGWIRPMDGASQDWYGAKKGVFEDEFGIRYRMGATGEYWHYEHHPLEHAESADEYEFPDVTDPTRFEKAARDAKKWKDEYAISGYMQWTLFEMAWYLRGYRKFISDLYSNPKFADELLDKVLKFRTQQAKTYCEIGVDIIRLGDDIGTQTGMMMSPMTWRKYLKPRLAQLIHTIKASNKDTHIFYHSDGNYRAVLPELMEIGVEMINPSQPECLDLEAIKEQYGDRLTFHGTMSHQEVLPFGTVDDVRKMVKARIDRLGKGGGLIIAPFVVDPDVPPENFLAIYETAKQGRKT